MITMFVRHKVEDFDKWKAAYDAFDSQRQSLGVTGHSVHRSHSNENEVTVSHEFATIEDAQAFSQNPKLVEIMRDSGVVGVPDIWFTNQV